MHACPQYALNVDAMDRSQHTRYLVYLKKYEYFGRGRPRLGSEDFVALEAEFASLKPNDSETMERRREILAVLLRD
jgi:hypothetical protein